MKMRPKMLVISILVYLLGLGALTYWNYGKTEKELLAGIDARLLSAAQSIKYVLAPDFHDRAIRKDAISAKEDETNIERLSRLAGELGVTFLSTHVWYNNRIFQTASGKCEDHHNPGYPERYWHPNYEPIYYEARQYVQATGKPFFFTATVHEGTLRGIGIEERSPGGLVYAAASSIEISHVKKLVLRQIFTSVGEGLLYLLLAVPLILAYGFIQRRYAKDMESVNITLRDNLEKQERLERMVETVADGEKLRLGQSLHDGLSQVLGGIALRCSALEQRLEEQNLPESRDAGLLAEMATKAVAETKDVARMLYPVELRQNGLCSALEELSVLTEKQTGIQCTAWCDKEPENMDMEVSINLYRIAQEAAMNAVRHGNPKKITVEFRISDGGYALRISDDGSGIPENTKSGKGMGLHIMEYRAHIIGGSLAISRLPEGGTEVVCRIEKV